MDDARGFLVFQIRERLRYYESLGLRGIARRKKTQTAEPAASRSLESIRSELGECTRCRLHQGRRTIVFGSGNPKARLMFIGEGPGHDEDVQGLPFVGAAGQLLTKIIESIDLTREEVYIANIVKCRPPGNREPEPDEVAQCKPFLDAQIASIRPRILCALGRTALQALLGTSQGIRELRGRALSYGDALLVPTYHPAYLLRNPGDKRKTWEDMKLIRSLLDEKP